MDAITHDAHVGRPVRDSVPPIPRDVETLDIDVVAVVDPDELASDGPDLCAPPDVRYETDARLGRAARLRVQSLMILARRHVHRVAGFDHVRRMLDGRPGMPSRAVRRVVTVRRDVIGPSADRRRQQHQHRDDSRKVRHGRLLSCSPGRMNWGRAATARRPPTRAGSRASLLPGSQRRECSFRTAELVRLWRIPCLLNLRRRLTRESASPLGLSDRRSAWADSSTPRLSPSDASSSPGRGGIAPKDDPTRRSFRSGRTTASSPRSPLPRTIWRDRP